MPLCLQVGQHQPADMLGFRFRQEHQIEPFRLAALLAFLLRVSLFSALSVTVGQPQLRTGGPEEWT